ncbi:MAG: tetratricopeptide repeat protein [Leptospiraceae bacterium]|nr:tetratricopeptide repeat protein [Leptospiraceae bacterium]
MGNQAMRVSEAARKLLIPSGTLRYWQGRGLISKTESLDFEALVQARLIQNCRSRGISLQKIRQVKEQLQIGLWTTAGEKSSSQTAATADAANDFWHNQVFVNPAREVLVWPRGEEFPHEPGGRQLCFHYFVNGQAGGESDCVMLADYKARERPADAIMPAEDEYLDLIERADARGILQFLLAQLQHHPENLVIVIETGNFYYEHNDLSNARKYYERALVILPGCVEALYNLANIHLREKRYAVAIRYFRRALEYNPEFAEAWYNLGLLLISLNYRQPAIDCMQRYCELDPDSEWADQARQLLTDLQQQDLNFETGLIETKDVLDPDEPDQDW